MKIGSSLKHCDVFQWLENHLCSLTTEINTPIAKTSSVCSYWLMIQAFVSTNSSPPIKSTILEITQREEHMDEWVSTFSFGFRNG